ncbi:hypothetical protein [Gilliamella sp. N-G2]|uniref:hypothetical protein n=1 Tax=Gilliamella sp. N-G2 TaxID=1970471 RepID=UPI000A32DEDF|nr:hypothetical protein [Gilliamella sp. N-G2]OTQ74711.1 hypothetical protein B6C99_02855 [Gilliamella sp. N-G2]
MEKLKQIYRLSPIVLLVITVFASYFAYQCFQDEQTAKKQLTELTSRLEKLQQVIEKNNQIIAQREQEKARDAISIKQLHEQMKDALKNNQCANEIMPSNISDWMRNGKN